MTEEYKTKFVMLNGNRQVIRTAMFGHFDTNPEKGRLLAKRYIEKQKQHWEGMNHQFVGGEHLSNLQIEEQ